MAKKIVLRRLKYADLKTGKYGMSVTIGGAARMGKTREQWKRYKKRASVRGIDLLKPVGWVEPNPDE